MRIHDIAFCIAGFFLLGVFLSSFRLSPLIILLAAALLSILFLLLGYLIVTGTSIGSLKATDKIVPRNLFWLAGLSFFVIAGALYSNWHNFHQIGAINIPFDQKVNFSGVVVKNPERGNIQKLIIELSLSGGSPEGRRPPYSGRVLVKVQPYPSFEYGDEIGFEGVIKLPEPQNYANYLAKDGIFGVVSFPKVELIAQNQGSSFQAQLFKFKERLISNFQKILAPEQAAFLSGITLGERAEFSKEFKDAMSRSGTTHLVALSGYNISIIVIAAFCLLNYFLSHRLSFVLTTLIIIGFVLMTGAETSVVRAAIMGFLVMLASQVGRIYAMRNAITLAAFFMVLINPKVLRFDVGFQLSFLAVLGIVYLSPAIRKFFRMKEEEGFLGWRENFLTTTSAQLAVIPLLIVNFDNFSPISLLTNILILELIPLTMFLGFLTGAIGFLSLTFSQILAWFTSLFLSYELFLIKIFAKFSFSIPKIGLAAIVFYYLIIIGFIICNSRLPKKLI